MQHRPKFGAIGQQHAGHGLHQGPRFVARDALAHQHFMRERWIADNQGAPVQHVQDGKPLTAHGAALLGVPWDGAK